MIYGPLSPEFAVVAEDWLDDDDQAVTLLRPADVVEWAMNIPNARIGNAQDLCRAMGLLD
jgi:hypothetical protein